MLLDLPLRSLATALLALALVAGAPVAPAAEPDAAVGVVNVNTATLEELQRLPGVGASRAKAILDARRERGGFESVDELLEVRGIGAASLERMRPHVVLEGPTRAPGR